MVDEQLSKTTPPGKRSGALFSRLASGSLGGRMPDFMSWEKLRDTSIPLGFLLTLAILAGPFVSWLDDYHADFITTTEANEQNEKIDARLHLIEEKLESNTEATQALQTELRIRMSLQLVESLEAKLYVLERDNADQARIHETKRDLDRALLYSNCLLDARPNCQHLEPGRMR